MAKALATKEGKVLTKQREALWGKVDAFREKVEKAMTNCFQAVRDNYVGAGGVLSELKDSCTEGEWMEELRDHGITKFFSWMAIKAYEDPEWLERFWQKKMLAYQESHAKKLLAHTADERTVGYDVLERFAEKYEKKVSEFGGAPASVSRKKKRQLHVAWFVVRHATEEQLKGWEEEIGE